ncbi:predicted protein [Verticillium alfalfae VaMs.102]|uniref:Predicted protein n=1 Tax=Verticillium alfalfae (strain VaMs.102 / ATCC MYA-4576 / FGSC 10136) TaxID=526221 RepID=C9SWD2_VERA1|nr:predicted protein [Verticillium alfalfae VaMs.102]EEY23097.1 predicted protein [Verticillium alfalfae VaMs.102]
MRDYNPDRVRELQAFQLEINQLRESSRVMQELLVASELSCEAGKALLDKAMVTVTRLQNQLETHRAIRVELEKHIENLESQKEMREKTKKLDEALKLVTDLKKKLEVTEKLAKYLTQHNGKLVRKNHQLEQRISSLSAQLAEMSDDEFHTPASSIKTQRAVFHTPMSVPRHGHGREAHVMNEAPPPLFRLSEAGTFVAKKEDDIEEENSDEETEDAKLL